jgi:apolipoprotein N-acyltransferase
MSIRTFQLLLVPVASLAFAGSWLDARFFPAAWIGLVILFWLTVSGSAWRAAVIGFEFGVMLLLVSFHWAPKMLACTLASEEGDFAPYSVFGLLVGWEAIPYAFLGIGANLVSRRSIPIWMGDAAWVALEWSWPRVFAWSIAHTQTGFTPLIQLAELGGASLLNFLMVVCCLSLAMTLCWGAAWGRQVAIPLSCLGLAIIFGYARLWSIEGLSPGETLRIGVVQVDPSYVDSTRRMRAAADKLSTPLDLVVWPESTLGTYSSAIGSLAEIKRSLKIVREPFIDQTPALGLGAWLLAGGKSFEANSSREDHYFQTAFLVDPRGEFRARYHKRTLMPIGEYMPWEESFPGLHGWAQLSEYVDRGESNPPVRVGDDALVGVLICYEETVPELARRTIKQGAQLLVSLINASAFEELTALDQHLRLAMLRSVENRRWLVRCAGTGLSCCITSTGRIAEHLPANVDAQFAVDVPLISQLTIYNRVGYLFPHGCAIAVASSSVLRLRKWNRIRC